MFIKSLKSLARSCLAKATRKRNKTVRGIEDVVNNSYYDRGFHYPYRGYEAIDYLLKHYDFDTVLDVGCGNGVHSEIFSKAGKNVTAIDYGKSIRFAEADENFASKVIMADFEKYDFAGCTFDCVWCCHVLEHQLNTQNFLTKLVSLVKTTSRGGGY